jgi:hypothetical protein
MSNPVKDSYDGGMCPDCDEPIPDDVNEGDSCKNCGHVFWEDTEDDFYDWDELDELDDEEFDDGIFY